MDTPNQAELTGSTPKKPSFNRAKLQLQSELGAVNRGMLVTLSFCVIAGPLVAPTHLLSYLPPEKEQHKVRLQALRKELTHLKATEWLYEPIEKLIGRGNQ